MVIVTLNVHERLFNVEMGRKAHEGTVSICAAILANFR